MTRSAADADTEVCIGDCKVVWNSAAGEALLVQLYLLVYTQIDPFIAAHTM